MAEQEIRKIGVLTSGGDAPGMNAAIRAVVRSALSKNMKVYGVHHGYNGLLEDDIEEMHIRSVSEIIHRGGTVLYTARSPEFLTLQGQQTAAANCRKHGIEAMVIIGGDGSFRGAKDLSAQEVPCVCIPGTIDNDIACTDYTIGYDTAMNTALEMVDKLRDTMLSHDRCSVVEVMGHRAGYIAANIGLAVGALVTVVPEKPLDVDKDIVSKMKFTKKMGKKHFIIIVAEGAGSAEQMAKEIEEKSGIEARPTVLGHVQRGGAPTVRDRVAATRFGYQAVELLSKGITDRVIGLRADDLVDFDIDEALSMKKSLDLSLLDINATLSV
ncbi:6-phosphofructokinase [Ruminococcaceae bacterium OttesenSCG-928-I18]|nr:6-phosphofructokinase [Ruminococcaceae bacterium OttesenSCG-928-I18]